MLLTKTLRSSTFRVALICIVVFGAVVIALFSYDRKPGVRYGADIYARVVGRNAAFEQ